MQTTIQTTLFHDIVKKDHTPLSGTKTKLKC